MTLQEILDRLSEEPGLLLSASPTDPASADKKLLHFTTDSRAVGKDSVYIAIRGEKVDGHQYVASSHRSGAALIICEEKATTGPFIQVSNTRLASALLAARFYQEPSKEMLVLGVTGTSGKTTTSYLLESILTQAGKKVGLIGTVEIRYGGKRVEATHTTPDAWILQKILAEMSDGGCDAVIMEVSSHALKQQRVSGIAFDGALFTNLTPEHLDYHPDIGDYYFSKKLLFTDEFRRSREAGKKPVGVIHVGEPYGKQLYSELLKTSETWVTAFEVPADAEMDAYGIRGTFSGVKVRSRLLARFNAENIAGAVALSRAVGVSPDVIAGAIESLLGVPGRLERVDDPAGRVILVDYAHKSDALEKVLKTLRPMRSGDSKLVCVFGCGGDRDSSKRPIMGKIACEGADAVILTSDNPRTEDPEKILDAIELGCRKFSNYRRITDRSAAIRAAIRETKAGDIVLIAGKGHETYQIHGTEKRHFDDREVARTALSESKGI